MLLLTQGWAYFSGFSLQVLCNLQIPSIHCLHWDVCCPFITLFTLYHWHTAQTWAHLGCDLSHLFRIDFNQVLFFSPPPSLFSLSLSRHHCLPMIILFPSSEETPLGYVRINSCILSSFFFSVSFILLVFLSILCIPSSLYKTMFCSFSNNQLFY